MCPDISSRVISVGVLLVSLCAGTVAAQPELTQLHEFSGYECTAQNAGLIEGRDSLLCGWIGHAGPDRRSVVWQRVREVAADDQGRAEFTEAISAADSLHLFRVTAH